MKVSIEDLIEKIYEEFDEVPRGTLQANTNFRTLENWGSMHALILIALADTEYDVQISGKDLKEMNTIQDLYNLISERIKNR